MDEFFNATQAIDFGCDDSLSDDEDDNKDLGKVVAQLDIVNKLHGCSGSYELRKGENVVGRSSSCAIHINSQTLSKEHAVIEISDDSYLIYDMGSTNKTRKGKIVLKPNVRYSIENGDVLTFADVECRFSIKNLTDTANADSASETGSESMFIAESTASEPDCGSKNTDKKNKPTSSKQPPPKPTILVEETPAPRKESGNEVLVPESQANDSGLDYSRTAKKSLIEDSFEGNLRLSASFNDSVITNDNSKTLGNDGTPNVTSISNNDDNFNSILMQPTQAYVPSSSDTDDGVDESILNAETQAYEEPARMGKSKLTLTKKTAVAKGKINFSESSDDATDNEMDELSRMDLLMADTQPFVETTETDCPKKNSDSKSIKIETATNAKREVPAKLSEPKGDTSKKKKYVPEDEEDTTDDDVDAESNRTSLLMAATQAYVETDDENQQTKSGDRLNRKASKEDGGLVRKGKKLKFAKTVKRHQISESEDESTDDDVDAHRMSMLMAATQPYVESEESEREAQGVIGRNSRNATAKGKKPVTSKAKKKLSVAKGKKAKARESEDDTTEEEGNNEDYRMSLLMAPTQPYIETEDSNNENEPIPDSKKNKIKKMKSRNEKGKLSKGKGRGVSGVDDNTSEEDDTGDEKQRMALLMAETQPYVEPKNDDDDESDEDSADEKAASVDLLAETQPYFELAVSKGAGTKNENKAKKTRTAKTANSTKPSEDAELENESEALLTSASKPFGDGDKPSTQKGLDQSAENDVYKDTKTDGEAETLQSSAALDKKEPVDKQTSNVQNETTVTTARGKTRLSRKKVPAENQLAASPDTLDKDSEDKSNSRLQRNASSEPVPIKPTLPYKASLDDTEDTEVDGVAGCEPTIAYSALPEDIIENDSVVSKKPPRGNRKPQPKSKVAPSRTTRRKVTLASAPSSSSIESSQESLREAEGIRLAVNRILDGPLKSSQDENKSEEDTAKVDGTESGNSIGFGSADTLILADSSTLPEVDLALEEINLRKDAKTNEISDKDESTNISEAKQRLTRGGRKNAIAAKETKANTASTVESKAKRGRRAAAAKKETIAESLKEMDDVKNEEDSLPTTRSRRVRTANKRFSDETYLTETSVGKTATPEPVVGKVGRKGRKSSTKESEVGDGDDAVESRPTAVDADSAKLPRSKLKLTTRAKEQGSDEDQSPSIPKIVIRRGAGQEENNSTYMIAARQNEVEDGAGEEVAVTSKSSRKRAKVSGANVAESLVADERPDATKKAKIPASPKQAQISRRRGRKTSSKEEEEEVDGKDLEPPTVDPLAAPRTPRKKVAMGKDKTVETAEAPVTDKYVRSSKRSIQQTPLSNSGDTRTTNEYDDLLSDLDSSMKNYAQSTEKSARRRGRPAKVAEKSDEMQAKTVAGASGLRRRKAPDVTPVKVPVAARKSSARNSRKPIKDPSNDTLLDLTADRSTAEDSTPLDEKNEDFVFAEAKRSRKRGTATSKESNQPPSPVKRPLSAANNDAQKRLKQDFDEVTDVSSPVSSNRSRSSSTASTPKSTRGKRTLTAEVEGNKMPPPATPPKNGKGSQNKRSGSSASASSSPAPSPKKRVRTPDSSAERTSRKRSEAKVSVMFTGLEDEKAAAIATRLGGNIVESVTDCTHLITDKVRRTFKFLCTVARGRPIITSEWLYKSSDAGHFLDPAPFLICDLTSEKQYKFKLSETLQAAQKQPLLEGVSLHVTTNVLPEPSQMKLIIQCAGGEVMSRMPIGKEDRKKIVVISCAKDLKRCAKIAGVVPVVSAECILTGVLQHKFDTNSYPLL